MEQSFDLVVVGTGVAAATVAKACRAAGWSVAVVDERPFGGTCVLRGCDPKKLLRRGPEIVDAADRLAGKGVWPAGLGIDWAASVARKRRFTDPVPEQRERQFAEAGIATFHGTASFLDAGTLAVGPARLRGRHFVIASGARPRPLPIEGAGLLTGSDDFMELDYLPQRVLFVGGGYVSFEFAHMAARAGCEVTVLNRGPRPLGGFDPDLVDRLVERSRGLGMTILAGTEVEAIEAEGPSLRVHARRNGASERFDCELAVHGAGRVPNLEALALDRAGVEAGKGGVEVDAQLRSVSNPAVWAAGDAAATPGPPLTPVANLEGEAVAANLLENAQRSPDYRGVPSVVFTIPALARVGLLEAEAREQGLDFECKLSEMGEWYSVQRVGETHAAAKTLVEKGSGRILGAHLLAPESGETINLFALAMQNDIPARRLRDFVSAYPSAGSDLSALV